VWFEDRHLQPRPRSRPRATCPAAGRRVPRQTGIRARPPPSPRPVIPAALFDP